MTFDLILAFDGTVLATATSPDALDFSAAYPYRKWGVVLRQAMCSGPYYTRCVARVRLADSVDFREEFDRAVKLVRDELIRRCATREFERRNMLDFLVDGPTIDINREDHNNDH